MLTLLDNKTWTISICISIYSLYCFPCLLVSAGLCRDSVFIRRRSSNAWVYLPYGIRITILVLVCYLEIIPNLFCRRFSLYLSIILWATLTRAWFFFFFDFIAFWALSLATIPFRRNFLVGVGEMGSHLSKIVTLGARLVLNLTVGVLLSSLCYSPHSWLLVLSVGLFVLHLEGGVIILQVVVFTTLLGIYYKESQAESF